jgi:hypothetical protein
MPKTALFETELYIDRNYLKTLGDYYDEKKLIQAEMSFTMNYTHTQNYKSHDATTTVTVVSIDEVRELCCCCNIDDGIDEEDEIPCYRILGCVLKTEEPIFTCLYFADLARPFTLHNDTTTIASGSVHKILDKFEYVPIMSE